MWVVPFSADVKWRREEKAALQIAWVTTRHRLKDFLCQRDPAALPTKGRFFQDCISAGEVQSGKDFTMRRLPVVCDVRDPKKAVRVAHFGVFFFLPGLFHIVFFFVLILCRTLRVPLHKSVKCLTCPQATEN